jgi:hypothetical protein
MAANPPVIDSYLIGSQDFFEKKPAKDNRAAAFGSQFATGTKQ